MRTAEECIRQAEALERLAETEPDGLRKRGYEQMAIYWREAAVKRLTAHPPE